jgi:hypothetical protein
MIFVIVATPYQITFCKFFWAALATLPSRMSRASQVLP